MTPDFAIRADGRDITAAIRDRFLALTVRDEAGIKSDQITLRLDDRPYRDGRRAALPVIGTPLAVDLGYRKPGLVTVGTYRVDEITYSGPPEILEVRASHADMTGPFRTPATRSWDDTTLGAIAASIADEHGYTARVAEALATVPVRHADQTDESPMAFLNRLAGAHDGIVKPVAGLLVLAPKGAAKSLSGPPLPEIAVTPEDLTDWRYAFSARASPGKCGGTVEDDGGGASAEYWHLGMGEAVTVNDGDEPRAAVRYTRADQDQARAAATTTRKAGRRCKATLSLSLPGNAAIAAEQTLTLSGFRPGIPTAWRVASVTHALDRSGFSTRLEAEVLPAD